MRTSGIEPWWGCRELRVTISERLLTCMNCWGCAQCRPGKSTLVALHETILLLSPRLRRLREIFFNARRYSPTS